MAALVSHTASSPALANASGAGTVSERSMKDVVIAGVFYEPGVECPRFRLESGEVITLAGTLPDLGLGAAARLSGRWAMVSTCMEGRTFHVTGVEEVKESP